MPRPTKEMTAATERLKSRRREVEERLAVVRRALDREVGWAPKTKVWLVPLVAFAFGLALAGLRRSRERRPSDSDERRAERQRPENPRLAADLSRPADRPPAV